MSARAYRADRSLASQPSFCWDLHSKTDLRQRLGLEYPGQTIGTLLLPDDSEPQELSEATGGDGAALCENEYLGEYD